MKPLSKVIIVISFLLFTATCLLLTAESAIPHLINYQGRLTDSSGVPLNGSYQLTFRIYDAETAGNMLWEEIHAGVVISKGIFSLMLGSVSNLNIPFDNQYYLEIKVGNEVMSPRQRIASSAYAMRAEHGVPKGVIVMWSGKIADIPSGWALCDGTNGTPDLRDRFIVGARQDEGGIAKTNITGILSQFGGSTFISVANLPPHTHTGTVGNAGIHSHSTNLRGGQEGSLPSHLNNSNSETSETQTDSQGEHTHSLTINNTGSGTSYTPPYYTLAYLMKL